MTEPTPGAPSISPPPAAPIEEGDKTGGLIPYKNPKALISYYLGFLSFLPLIGVLIAVAAIVLGILGLKERKKRPIIKGSIHAWVGIVLSAISLAFHLLIVLSIVVAATAASRRR